MNSGPPPDPEEFIERPPEGWRGVSNHQFQWMVVWATVVVVLACFIWSTRPVILRSAKSSVRSQAVSNARQIGLALLEFDQDYGEFPSARTLPEVAKLDPAIASRGTTSSNDLFAQLIAYGVQSERIFHCRHPAVTRKGGPDDVVQPISRALEPGECGFTYCAGMSWKMNAGLPVVCAPMVPGTETFDPAVFSGRAVILRIDNSVGQPIIRSSDGKAFAGNGKTLFETGPDTVWDTILTPDLRHPER